MYNSLILGADIGGSHITAALVDVLSGTVMRETYVRRFVDSHQEPVVIIKAWAEAIRQAFSQGNLPVSKIGIAMPGPMDYEQGICLIKDQDKYEHLYGLNIKELLAAELSIPPSDIRFLNDACGFLQGEVLGTLENQYGTIMGFTLGTGLGSAVYRDGEVFDADLWQMPFRESIAEDYLSTRWFVRRYAELKGETVNDVKHLLDKLKHDPVVTLLFEEFGTTLGSFLNECIALHRPEALVLGGNIARSHELFLGSARTVLSAAGNDLPVSIARLGEEAALTGAAGTWKKTLLAERT